MGIRDELLRKQHDLELENNKLRELLHSKSSQDAQVDENRKIDEEFSAKPLKSIKIVKFSILSKLNTQIPHFKKKQSSISMTIIRR
jgi:hypothetical protein